MPTPQNADEISCITAKEHARLMGHDEYTKLVKLDPAQREALMNRLSQKNALGSPIKSRTGGNRRRDARWDYRHADMALLVEHPGGGISRLLVCARNISAGGISFLHGGFLHPGSRCKLSLLQTDASTNVHTGTIVSCRHIERTLHEVGLRFDNRIETTKFVQANAATSDEASITLTTLQGNVLYVDASAADQNLMRFYLESCGATVQVATTVAEANEHAKSNSFLAIITELSFAEGDGASLIEQLRQSGAEMPIIAVTADERAELRERAEAAGCDAVLIKPLDFDALTALLRRLVPATPSPAEIEPLYSTQWEDAKMRPLIESFLDTLQSEAQQLSIAIADGNTETLRKICLMLKGSATGYGYPQITEAAQSIVRSLDQSAELTGIQATVSDLLGTCAAACKVRTDASDAT